MHTKTIGLIAHTGKRDVAELVNAIAKEFERFSISFCLRKRRRVSLENNWAIR